MKAYIKVYDAVSGQYEKTMEKDAKEFGEWLERAFKRGNVFSIDFTHFNVDTERKFFEVEVR